MENGVQVAHTDEKFVDMLAKWDKEQFLICAGTSGTDEGESTAMQGLVQGHAYTIQSVLKVDGFKMLRCVRASRPDTARAPCSSPVLRRFHAQLAAVGTLSVVRVR
jgi:hypothetical protein